MTSGEVLLLLGTLGAIMASSRPRTTSGVRPTTGGGTGPAAPPPGPAAPPAPAGAGNLRGKTPSGYAADYLPMLRGRYAGELGQLVREWGPRVLPGAPATAILGMTTIGRQRENTGEGNPPANRVFHEIGYFQTPAGPASGPAPNPDPSLPYSHWADLGQTELVRGLLGRAPTLVAGAWRDAIPDQVAVGLADLKAERARLERLLVAAGIPTPTREGSPMDVALTFMAFSAGPASAANALRQLGLAEWVTDLDSPNAFTELVTGALGQYEHMGRPPPGPGRYPNPWHALLRVWQKLSAGYALAKNLRLPEQDWYPVAARGRMPRTELELTQLANNVRPT